jgi:hypothetical protein
MQIPNGAGAQLYAFGLSGRASSPLDKAQGVSPLTKAVVTPSLTAFRYEVVGIINSNNYIIEDNTYLVLKGQRSYDFAVPDSIKCSAEIYLRMSRDAPYYSVTMDLPTHPNAVYQKMRFVGRFDILNIDEIEELGLITPNSGLATKLRHQTVLSVKRVFEITKIADAVKAKPTIKMSDEGGVFITEGRSVILD